MDRVGSRFIWSCGGIAAGLAVGLAAGVWLARGASPASPAAVPGDWVARIGERYIGAGDVEREMRRRGGERPGLFQTAKEKRALLEDMLLRESLADAARAAGLDREPETRATIDQLLIERYLEGGLRKRQKLLRVSEAEIAAYYEEHAADYATPARRRVAMLRIDVAANAPEQDWKAAERRAAEAVAKVQALQPAVPDFGRLAIEYSSDAASRYRGGSLGWLSDARRDGYAFDKALLGVAFALTAPGSFSPVVRGQEAVYVARLVEREESRPRELAQLRSGIERTLLRQRLAEAEAKFRAAALAAADIDVHESRLEAIRPPGPPAQPPQPPALPGLKEAAP